MDDVAELLKEQEIEIQLKTGENISIKKTIEMLEKELAELRSGKFESQNEPEKDAKDKLKIQEMTRSKMKIEAEFFAEVYDMQMENMKLLKQVKKLEKENSHLNVKYKDIELLYEKTDRDLRDRDIWVEEIVAEIIHESRRKEIPGPVATPLWVGAAVARGTHLWSFQSTQLLCQERHEGSGKGLV